MYIGNKTRSQLERDLIVAPPDPEKVATLKVVEWPPGVETGWNIDRGRTFLGPKGWPWGELEEFHDGTPHDVEWARRRLLARMTSRFEFEEVPLGNRVVALAVIEQPGHPNRLYCVGRDLGAPL